MKLFLTLLVGNLLTLAVVRAAGRYITKSEWLLVLVVSSLIALAVACLAQLWN